MKIQERSFSGKTFRPKPSYYLSSNKKLITVITPWGQEAVSAGSVFESLEAQYNLFSEDKESTHPFPKKMSLTPMENDMRTAVIQTNEKIFNDINETEYSMGFELLFAGLERDIFTVIQIGQPMIFIDRPGQYLRVIGQVTDPFLETALKKNHSTPPLPYHLLGIHEDISFRSFFFRLHPADRLVFLNRNFVPTKWFNLKREERTLDNLSQLAAEEDPHIPFWLALLDPKED